MSLDMDMNLLSAASSLIGYTRSLTEYDIAKSEDGWTRVSEGWVDGLRERVEELQSEIDLAFRKD